MLSTQVTATETSGSGTVPYHTAGLDRLSRTAHQLGLGYLWKNFESKIPSLFVDDATESNIGVGKAGRDRLQWVSTLDELYTTLEEGTSTLLVLNRYNSWSRIEISIQAFSVVCHFTEITPFFLHFLVGMGRKFSSKDEEFMSCYSTFTSEDTRLASSPNSGMEKDSHSLWGICYNICHFERHTRDLEDPWSCRQSALHHSYSAVSKQSTWIVIQPPQAFDLTISSTQHPMSLHLRYLHAGLANWREYLDSFAQKLKLLNQQIAIPNPYKNFKINFSHEQHLHHLKGKLHHARSILINTRNTFSTIAEHEVAVAQEQCLCPAICGEFQRELRNLSRDVDNYIETSNKFLLMTDDLKSMYDNILTFHGQEVQHDTSLKLAQLAQADAAGNRDMAVLADLTYKDSRSVRIATAIAMFYLPVNLVVSFFSTTLVWYGTGVDAADNSKMQVRREIWIATVAAIVLAVSTACWAWWWNWKEQKKPEKKAFQENDP